MPLRLTASLDDDGRLLEEAYERLADAVEEFLAVSRAAGAEQILAVGTSALRDAVNGPEIVERLREQFGLDLRVIDGETEAHYGFLGAVHGLPVDDGMLIDIGGGSVELARFRDRRVEQLWSFQLGTLRAGRQYLADDPPTEDQLAELRSAAEAAVRDAEVPALRRRERLIGTGGSIRNVAKVDRRRRRRSYPVPRLHGYEVRRGRLAKVGELLSSLDARRRRDVPGLNPSRAETIVAGITVLQAIMSAVKARTLLVSGQGLREGVLRGALSQLPPSAPASRLPDPGAVRRASIRSLAARFARMDDGASLRRSHTALELLAGLEASVGESLEELIEYAPVVVQAGAAIDFYNRERVAADIVTNTDLAGFSHLMVAEFAALVRLIEEPRFDVHRFAPLLSEDERERLDLAATALALSFELHRRIPPAAVPDVRSTVSNKYVTLEVLGSIGPLPESLLERVERDFGRRVRVRTGREA